MTLGDNIWTFLIAAIPTIAAAGAWIQGAINRRTAKKIQGITESSHALINQRFTDLEEVNKTLRTELMELRTARDTAAGQATAILDAAREARAIIEAAATTASTLLATRANEAKG